MRNLTEENIRTYFDEHEWININRQKTGVVSNIRLLDIAKRCGITKHITWHCLRHSEFSFLLKFKHLQILQLDR